MAQNGKALDFQASMKVNVDGVKRVGLMLGPYRNLTTLLAASLYLHPRCQVLNHAGQRILNDPRLDFFINPLPAVFECFLRYAMHISGSGRRGNYGGSITCSHAFEEKHRMGALHAAAGGMLMKEKVDALIWKESLMVSIHMRKNVPDMDRFLKTHPRLVFLMPVRNPLDCALSNIRTGHAAIFPGSTTDMTIEQVTKSIFEQFFWFETLRASHPERFFAFFAHRKGSAALTQLAAFLGLEPEPAWVENAKEAFEVKANHHHDPRLVDQTMALIESHFRPFPDFAKELMHFFRQ
jgi:hypothetical protein